jgi:hypothetical protein
MKLRDIAHTRSGDKGDTLNVSVIAYDPKYFDILLREVTCARVKGCLGDMVQGSVTRYELPNLGALNFVLSQTLSGGVTRSLAIDSHGKSLSAVLLSMDINGESEL